MALRIKSHQFAHLVDRRPFTRYVYFSQKAYAGLQCYITQLSSNSWIADGGEYFRAEYPAKSSSVEHETLAWICAGTTRQVQYIALQNAPHYRPRSGVVLSSPWFWTRPHLCGRLPHVGL